VLDNECATDSDGDKTQASYIERLEKGIARANRMLDDKWFDLRTISRCHRDEAALCQSLLKVIDEVCQLLNEL
jgi:hypothetical protein